MTKTKKIFKYKLDYIDHQEHIIIYIPMPAKILSVAEQNNVAVLYVLVGVEKKTIPIDILIIGTGLPIHDNIDMYKFIGTVKLDYGKYMWHVFYRYVDVLTEDGREISDVSLELLNDTFVNKNRSDVTMA